MRKIFLLVVAIILAGCASTAPTIEIPTNTPEPTKTPEPISTPEPTNTPEPTLTPTLQIKDIAVSKNKVTTIEKAGVVFEVERMLVADRKGWPDNYFDDKPEYNKATTFIMVVFRITNNTSGTIDLLMRDFCTVLAGNEQVDCDSLKRVYIGEDIDTLMTGVTRVGGLYLPFNTPRSEIKTITFEAPGAFNSSGNGFTGDITFSVDITDWVWEDKLSN